MTIQPAEVSDLPGIRWLLSCDDLPIEDLDEESVRGFLVIRDGNALAGAVGFELYEKAALLRSLVVAPEFRGRGFGTKLAQAVEELAGKRNRSPTYLLTTTAEHFFAARGFRVVSRADVPDEIRRSTQFAWLCPATAIVMVKP